MRNGRSYPPLTPGRRTSASGFSSSPGLLLTPTAANVNDGESLESWERRRQANLAKHINGNGQGTPLAIAAQQLLKTPTPTAADGDRTSATYPRGDATLIGALLPTPRATDGTKGGPNQRGSSGDLMLPSAVMQFLPTPSVADATGGHKTRSGDRKGEPLLGGIAMLLPTPSAMDSHGARNATATRHDPKPTTQTGGWTLADVFWTGDLTGPPSPGGSTP
jgi:hypothetical protein